MRLRLELSDDGINRLGRVSVEPWRDLHDRLWLGRLEDQEADDALHPRRVAFQVGRDDDVVGARLPVRTVPMPDAVDALGRLDQHRDIPMPPLSLPPMGILPRIPSGRHES
jgi:hypothetical protein